MRVDKSIQSENDNNDINSMCGSGVLLRATYVSISALVRHSQPCFSCNVDC